MTKARREYWRALAQFCKWYGMTPAEVREMPVAQFNEFHGYMRDSMRERNKRG